MNLVRSINNKPKLLSIAAMFMLAACSSGDSKSNTGQNVPVTTTPTTPAPTNKPVASQVFVNGAIYTVNSQQEWAQAIAIKDNEILYVGTNEGVNEYTNSATTTVDLGGKMVLPGFHDVHIHPIESGSANTVFTLETDELDPENFADAIAQAAADNPDVNWLIGYGHDVFTLLEATRPPIEIIDDVVADRPVIIMEQTSHSMWVNSKALELAGIDSNTPDPIGGMIMRDEITAEPNGVLIDNAGNIVYDLALQPTPQTQRNDYDGLVQYTMPELNKNGITSISDARSFWRRNDHLTWIKANDNNELTLRVNVGLWAYPEVDDVSQLQALKELYSNDSDSLLKFNQIKLYSDGLLSNGTAALHEPYLVDMIGLAGNRGLNYFDESRLAYYIAQLEPVGFDFHIHTIGDRGIHEALNAIETSGSVRGRHRLTHVEIMDPADHARFAELNVTADAQTAGDFSKPSHWHENDEIIGPVRADNAIPIKSLTEAGARVTLSSDWNVNPFNPFIGLQNAVTRAPQELTLAQAIQAYTMNGAYTMKQEDKVGSIEAGKLADFIVIDQNLFEINETAISKTKVLMTYFDGELVYQR